MDYRKVPSGAKSADAPFRFGHLSGVTIYSKGSWIPRIDVYLSDDSLIISVEVAGMKRENISLEASKENRRLRIRGHRTMIDPDARVRFILMDIPSGNFDFYIDLPEGYHLPSAKPRYHNGILRIEIPLISPP